MSLINDYTFLVEYNMRRSELMARAEEERLARSIRAGSTPWWRRLVGRGAGPFRALASGVRTHSHRVAN